MPASISQPIRRVASVDIYRGLVMTMMLAEVLRLPRVARALPDSAFWDWLGWFQTHVEWRGLTPHDLIQPSFSFLVGVALPFSLIARHSRGQTQTLAWLHAAFRALALVALGVFLRSTGSASTNYTFEDTLSQIGLGYLPLFALAHTSRRVQVLVLALILGGYFVLFAAWPLPTPDHDWPAVGVPANWPEHPTGFAAHWSKNANPAWAFDVWFLNRFPRAEPFQFNGGGYATLSFIPTLATMILGLFAGQRLRWSQNPLGPLALAGGLCLAVGVALDQTGLCPSVKRIWTPAWVLLSGGICYLVLAGFVFVADIRGWVRWAFPLRVVGANAITAYVLDHLMGEFVQEALVRHLGREPFLIFGPEYEPVLLGAAKLALFWLFLFWLWQNRAFIRI